MQLEEFFAALWAGYVSVAPQAGVIHDAFRARGEPVVNDHVAFRTFDRPPVSVACLEPLLLSLGYRRFAPYEFPQRRLRACGYVHRTRGVPRVFFSELRTAACSAGLQRWVAHACERLDPDLLQTPGAFFAGRVWPAPSWPEYEALRSESDYAAWVAALGLRANHFTVSVNALTGFREVSDVVRFVESLGYPINEDGGRIKGGADVLLEQASTLADRALMPFAGGEMREIPTCYYEFARRYPDADGQIYEGFVAASADRLFTSTRDAG